MTAQGALAFSFDDVKKKATSSSSKDCDKKCKKKKKRDRNLAIGAAAITIIAAMVIKYKSTEVRNEDTVVKSYTKKNKKLPQYSTALSYDSNALPSDVVKPGKKVHVKSDILVVPGREDKTAKIEEKLTIYDNVKNTLELKSLVKAVNPNPHYAGEYQSEFTFTLPEGMPQGVYPVKTTLLLNGKEVKSDQTQLQLVMNVDVNGEAQIMHIASL